MRKTTIFLALAAATAVLAAPVAAQVGQAGQGRMGAGPDRAEAALRLRETLGLSQEQVQRLEQLRQEQLAHRQARAEQAMELRSRVAAGDITAEDAREQFRQMRLSGRDPEDGALQEILTDEQRAALAHQGRGARGAGMGAGAGAMGPVGAVRPGARSGMRGGMAPGARAGARRGGAGQGFGPGAGLRPGQGRGPATGLRQGQGLGPAAEFGPGQGAVPARPLRRGRIGG